MIKMLQYKMYPAGELRCPTTALVDSSNGHVQSPIWTTDMFFCMNLPQGLYYMSVNCMGSGEAALMHRLI